jgi:SsrA-binding protein
MEAAKVTATNRKAYRDYYVQETIEAGIALTGTEIKSVRAGKVSLRDSYARTEGGELWLFNSHIAHYEAGGRYNPEPGRPRKLLLHRQEIDRLASEAVQKGYTLVPLKLYLKRGFAKVELGLAKGKRLYDKRQVITRREAEREMGRVRKTSRQGGV